MSPISGMLVVSLAAGQAWAAAGPAAQGGDRTAPLYRVTVVERTVKAVNYQYHGGPTPIDFRGTVLLPEAKGDAVVESKAGRTAIDARFEHLLNPARYGREYLTYVLWAITPEGRATNLGEIIPNGLDKAKLHATTDLQAFGLIVTAEPYAAVRQPSDVVVMENEIRPDTIGKIEPIQAKTDLMPRGEYTYNIPADSAAAEVNAPRVSMSAYEEMLEVYQAQNAIQIAAAMGAGQYAADTLERARELLRNAQSLETSHAGKGQVIAEAREAGETAEDARSIAMKRRQKSELAAAQAKENEERQLRLQAEAAARSAQAQTQAAQSEAQAEQTQASAGHAALDPERAALAQAQGQAAVAAQIPPPAPQRENLEQEKRAFRMDLYQQLRGSALETMDTPRGLVAAIPAKSFTGRSLLPGMDGRIARVAAVITAHPGLNVEVDDYGEGANSQRAESIRAILSANGVPAAAIAVRAAGNARPVASNATPAGREANRRVEIVISGDSIGNLPYWDHTYSFIPR